MPKPFSSESRPRGQPQVGNNGEPQVPPSTHAGQLSRPSLAHTQTLFHKPCFINPFSSENRPHGLPQASNNGEPYVPPHSAGPPAVSSNPREPLTGGAEMMDALSEIPVEARQNFWYGRVQVKDQVWHQANDTGFFVSVAKPKVFRTATGNVFENQCGEKRIAVTSSTRSQDQPYTSAECIQQVL